MTVLLPSDPRVIGRYRIVERIGEGGMGVVFRALDPEGREVALKLIRPELAGDPAFRVRFAREVDAGRRVGGISTVRYLDADVESAHPFLVTDYVRGGNLSDFVRRHGSLAWDPLIELAIGLAQALVAMNSVGVIHRDLKPTNVLLGETGPRVADFGISQGSGGSDLTQTGLLMGSPAWMAPEQAVGSAASSASDVFSWGATVAFAGSGRPPFGDDRPDAVLYRVVHQEADLASLDPRLLPLVDWALRKDPAGRPDPEQLLIHLIQTATSGIGPPPVVAPVDGPTGSVAQATAAGPVVADPRPEKRRGRAAIWVVAAVAAVLVGGVAGGVIAEHRTDTRAAPKAPVRVGGLPSTTTSTTTPASTSTTTAGAGVAPTTSVPPTAADTAVDLPMDVCQTTFGIQPSSIPVLPSTMSESVPSGLASQLEVYTDQLGSMKLIAPAGWSCSAEQSVDGGSYVSVFPPGQPDPESSSGTADEAIVGSQTGACVGCALTQASPLFPDAAALCAQDYGGDPQSCPTTPDGETTFAVAPAVEGFLDPAGVQGTGEPSGGQNPANGVMTYHPDSASSQGGSYLDTCTLPESMHSVCTVALDRFVDDYGNA